MRLLHALTAAALLAVPSLALAQAMDQDQPSTAAPPSSTSSGSYGAGAGAGAGATSSTATPAVTAGLPVKDKTGATIGSVADVKTDAASGKQVATIQMGADKFAVDTSAIAVENGSAVINASQSEIKAMLPKHK